MSEKVTWQELKDSLDRSRVFIPFGWADADTVSRKASFGYTVGSDQVSDWDGLTIDVKAEIVEEQKLLEDGNDDSTDASIPVR